MSPISKLVAKYERLSDSLSNRPAQPYPGQQAHQNYPTQHAQQSYPDEQPYHAQQAYYEQPTQPAYPVQRAGDQKTLASSAASVNVFEAIATGPPPSQIQSRGDHPAPRIGIAPQNGPLSTNKFYANLFLGGQNQGVWTHPYSVTWSKGSGNAQSWGFSIAQIESEQKAYGPPNGEIPGSPVQYFINPIGIQSIIMSATELRSSTVLTTDSLGPFSVNANLLPQAGSNAAIKFPLVQGMGFVTGIYTNLQPTIQSSVFFRSVQPAQSPRSGIYKYHITLEDNRSWFLYAMPKNRQDLQLRLVSNTLLQGHPGWSGVIQVAKNPSGPNGESTYDGSAGVYATSANISGFVDGQTGTYQLSWLKSGLDQSIPLLMFALPHHLQSFDGSTKTGVRTSVRLQTTTKGSATAVVADRWTLIEPSLPLDMGFAPWSLGTRSASTLSRAAVNLISAVASEEIKQDMDGQSNLDSMYFSGKALSKFATLIYTAKVLAHQNDIADQGLIRLKSAFARFTTNKQKFPLVYDTAWKGIISSASYVLHDAGVDFGNSYYNDHHFHYGYFIHAAAIIASLDPSWLNQNRDYVNTLVRDAANPSAQDNYFPISRAFDWYHGHSFAKGLFESADGKDQESSSEDAFFAYAIKMWGHVIGDASMEARGTLMLAIMARSFQNYFLMESNNANQPASFIGNKVTGILFENKIDHTTYFGGNIEYIHGIHMIPLSPCSAFVRTRQFVIEEWNALFSERARYPVDSVGGGWKGILYANLGLIDPKRSYEFFAQKNFDSDWLDGGATRAWYLAYAAGLGGA